MIKATRFVRADGMEIADPYATDIWHVRCMVDSRVAFYSFKKNKWVWSSSIDFSNFSDYETFYMTVRTVLETEPLPTAESIGPSRKI